MEKPKTTPRSGTRTFLCLELLWEPPARLAKVTMLASRAGSDDVAERAWLVPQGIPTDSQLRDIAYAVAKHVTDATVAFCGVQQAMEVGA